MKTRTATAYVVGFMTDGIRVALIRKTRPNWQAGKLNGVGGGVEEPYETFKKAMVREFDEETGVKTTEADWHKFAAMKGGSPCNPEREDEWEIEFFICVTEAYCLDMVENTNNKLVDAGSVTERIELIALSEIHYGRKDMIANLPWMIPLALDSHAKTTIAINRPGLTTVIYP